MVTDIFVQLHVAPPIGCRNRESKHKGRALRESRTNLRLAFCFNKDLSMLPHYESIR